MHLSPGTGIEVWEKATHQTLNRGRPLLHIFFNEHMLLLYIKLNNT